MGWFSDPLIGNGSDHRHGQEPGERCGRDEMWITWMTCGDQLEHAVTDEHVAAGVRANPRRLPSLVWPPDHPPRACRSTGPRLQLLPDPPCPATTPPTPPPYDTAESAVTDVAARQIHGVAKILAEVDPGAWRRLLAEHTADHSGHCRACRPSSGAAPVWPCSLRAIADEAERITAARSG